MLGAFQIAEKALAVPGASDALSARLIEAHGHPCVYIGSYATAASRFGITDTGLLSMEALVAQARTLTTAVRVPVIADAESGFDDPGATVRAFEDCGVAAIHIEDHTGAGKHTSAAQTLRPAQEAGADMVVPTMVGGAELAEVRRRIDKPLMIVDNPGEQHAGAAIVLYYAFSITRQFAALQRALADGKLASDPQPLEDFLG